MRYTKFLMQVSQSVVFSHIFIRYLPFFYRTGDIQATSNQAEVGETVTVTCSTKCAWAWHTVFVDGNHVDSAVLETKDLRITVKNEILNCPNCNYLDELDCSDDSQGPVQSSVNLTFLTSGDHYVQCIAHLFQPDSELWPSNRIVSIPSIALRIDGIEKEILPCKLTYNLSFFFE